MMSSNPNPGPVDLQPIAVLLGHDRLTACESPPCAVVVCHLTSMQEIGEIAKLEVDSDSELLQPYRNRSTTFFHGRFIWEWGRMIDLVFAHMSVKVKEQF